jgi:hypothetical protein
LENQEKVFATARITINIVGMLGALRRLLGSQVTIGELIVVALILGTPYLIVGVIWSSTHTEHLQHMAGADPVVSYWGRSCHGRCCSSPTSA